MVNKMKDDFDLSNLRKKPKRKNSRAKGAAFENKVAKILNNRFNTSEFSRTPGSGAFATTHKLPDHLKLHGDLITPKNFKFIIECKKGYNEQGLHSLLDYDSKIWEWVEHMETDGHAAQKQPILLMAQDRKPIVCILEFDKSLGDTSNPYSILHGERKTYMMLYLEDLLTQPDHFFLEE